MITIQNHKYFNEGKMWKVLRHRLFSHRILEKASKRRLVEVHHLEKEKGIRSQRGSIHVGHLWKENKRQGLKQEDEVRIHSAGEPLGHFHGFLIPECSGQNCLRRSSWTQTR